MNSRKSSYVPLAAGLAILPLASFYIARSVTVGLRRAPERSVAERPQESRPAPAGGTAMIVSQADGTVSAAEPLQQNKRPSPAVPLLSQRAQPEPAQPGVRTPSAGTDAAATRSAQVARERRRATCPPCPEAQPCRQVQDTPTGAVKPAASFVLMPAPPSTFRSAINKVPGLRRLQRSRYKAGDNFTPARPVSFDAPEVPATLDDQTTAVVIAEVGESGEVRKARRRAGDELLGAIAAAAVRNWRFEPATLSGEPVKSDVVVHFTFNAASARRRQFD